MKNTKNNEKLNAENQKKMKNKVLKTTKLYDLRYRGYFVFKGTQMDCIKYLMEEEDKNVCICFSSGGYSLYPLLDEDYVEAEPLTRNDKQSSVDLFIDQLEEMGKAYEENQGGRTINISIDISDYMELKVQAKAMHKKEIIKFGCLLTQAPQHIIEEAYNETFGGGEQ